MNKQNKGITLVALVITIIVLIILAGVSINAVMNGGIIINAKNAKNKYEEEKKEEETEITDLEVQTDFLTKITIGQEKLNNGDATINASDVVEHTSYLFKNGYLTGIQNSDTVESVNNNLPVGYEIDSLKTGATLKKDGEKVGIVIRYGDIDGSGNITISDSTYLDRLLESETVADECQKIAADVNHDGKVNLEDATYINVFLAGNNEGINQNVEALTLSELQIKYNDELTREYIDALSKESNKYSIVLNTETNYYCLTGVTSETQIEDIIAVLNKLPGTSEIWRYNETNDEDEKVISGPCIVDDYIIVTDEDNGDFLWITITF